MSNKDWKSDIGEFFMTRKIYRNKYLNQQLNNIVKEWVDYLNKFDGIDANWQHEYDDKVIVKISIRTKYKETWKPYIIQIAYRENISGEQELDIDYSMGNDSRKILEGASDENSAIMIKEIIQDDFIYEPPYVLQTLNNILKKQFSELENR